MRNMACQTVLDRGRMLPHERASDFRVTLKALQIDVLGVDQFVGDRPVGVVAVRALHFALPNGVM